MTLDISWNFPIRHMTPEIGGVCPAKGFTPADEKVCNCGSYTLFLRRMEALKALMEKK